MINIKLLYRNNKILLNLVKTVIESEFEIKSNSEFVEDFEFEQDLQNTNVVILEDTIIDQESLERIKRLKEINPELSLVVVTLRSLNNYQQQLKNLNVNYIIHLGEPNTSLIKNVVLIINEIISLRQIS